MYNFIRAGFLFIEQENDVSSPNQILLIHSYILDNRPYMQCMYKVFSPTRPKRMKGVKILETDFKLYKITLSND